MTRRIAPKRPPQRRTSSPHLDPYAVGGTITLAEYRAARAAAPDVHIVLPLEDTSVNAA